MEKAIEIKRRAQRCILNGDLDGALAAYEKLVASGDPDPYYCVLLADLLHKKSQVVEAQKRYFEALEGYSKQALYKNAIAVCKKMSRLGIMPVEVTRRLAELHALDGFNTEASLCFLQHADLLTKQDELDPARASLQRAIELNPENLKALERLGEVEVLAGNGDAAVGAWLQAAQRYEALGQAVEAKRWRNKAEQVKPGSSSAAPRAPIAGSAREAAAADDAPPAARPPRPIEAIPRDASAPSDFMFERTPPGLSDSAEEQAEVEEYEPPARAPAGKRPAPVPRPEEDRSEDLSGPPVLRPRPSVDDREEIEQIEEVEEPEPPRRAAPRRPPPAEDDEGPPVMRPRSASADAAPAGPRPSRNGEGDADDGEDAPRARPGGASANPTIAAAAAAAANREASLRIERFGSDAARSGRGANAAGAPFPADESGEEGEGIAAIGALLREAQALFKSGNRASASATLLRAAQAYDQMERFDSAAAIYRSMGNSTDSSLQLMMLWLKNCQRRNDRREAARVACDLGDRAINDGDLGAAKEWFERAHAYDPENEVAPRRLRHLEEKVRKSGPAPAARTPAAEPLNVTTERNEPVIIDLGTLIEEFQQAVQGQLESDPQGHYDLGMSYREMGLLEPAIESFRSAAEDPKFFLRAKELIGRCLLDLGHFDEAAEELHEALSAPDLRPSVSHDLRYQLGLALEAAGRAAEALAEFESVYAAQANYPDVAMKIRVLRKSVESR